MKKYSKKAHINLLTDQLAERLNKLKNSINNEDNFLLLQLLAEEAIDSLQKISLDYERDIVDLKIDIAFGYVDREEADEVLDERNEFAGVLNENLNKKLNKEKNQVDGMKEYYQKVPLELLRGIIKRYAEEHPYRVNEKTFAYGVLAEFRRELTAKLDEKINATSDENEKNRLRIRSKDTKNKYIKIILKEYGFKTKPDHRQ
ncbi:MAG: hypothetical protein GY787_05810 [Alteromonadales bacterium]|nr:hypothetical protein [Alteromonadales bacterium]